MVSILGQGLYGQATERKLFETKMYSIEEISHFGVSDEKFAALSDAQKRSLIEARSDLGFKFVGVQRSWVSILESLRPPRRMGMAYIWSRLSLQDGVRPAQSIQ
jgi:hypothetical protein